MTSVSYVSCFGRITCFLDVFGLPLVKGQWYCTPSVKVHRFFELSPDLKQVNGWSSHVKLFDFWTLGMQVSNWEHCSKNCCTNQCQSLFEGSQVAREIVSFRFRSRCTPRYIWCLNLSDLFKFEGAQVGFYRSNSNAYWVYCEWSKLVASKSLTRKTADQNFSETMNVRVEGIVSWFQLLYCKQDKQVGKFS